MLFEENCQQRGVFLLGGLPPCLSTGLGEGNRKFVCIGAQAHTPILSKRALSEEETNSSNVLIAFCLSRPF